MPKRSNPYIDEVPLQSKIHVRDKEVNLGVNKDQNMKAVYERTWKFLFGSPQMHGKVSSEERARSSPNNVDGSVLRNDAPANGKKCCQINGVHKCSFCETQLCSECLQLCGLCDAVFCPLCSVMQYQRFREAALCLTCL